MQTRFIFILSLVFFILSPNNVTPSTINKITWFNQPLAKGVFLVASPNLVGPYFSKSVVLIAEYGQDGALGMIINRPSNILLSKVLPDIEGLEKKSGTLFFGGPVSRNLPFILLRTEKTIKNTRPVFDNVYYSTSIKAIVPLMENKNPQNTMRVYAGHASWSPGQLEAEVTRGSWKIIRADEFTIFEKDPKSIWDDLISGNKQLLIKKLDNNNKYPLSKNAALEYRLSENTRNTHFVILKERSD